MSPSVDVKTLFIDGQEVSARAGQTILEVAREHNISIPTLCHLDGLSDVGACRLCVVEIKGNNKLFPACVTTVFEGMEVTTVTERLQKHRKTILELQNMSEGHLLVIALQRADGNILRSGFLEERLAAGDAVIIIGRVLSLPPALREEVDRQDIG